MIRTWTTSIWRQIIILFHNNLSLSRRRKGCERNTFSRVNSCCKPMLKILKACRCRRVESNKRLNRRKNSPNKSKSRLWRHGGLTASQSASSTLISSSVQPVVRAFRARKCTQNIATQPSTRSYKSSTMSSKRWRGRPWSSSSLIRPSSKNWWRSTSTNRPLSIHVLPARTPLRPCLSNMHILWSVTKRLIRGPDSQTFCTTYSTRKSRGTLEV